jgi:RNA polymerase sigma-70 factor (ECF subfamily)
LQSSLTNLDPERCKERQSLTIGESDKPDRAFDDCAGTFGSVVEVHWTSVFKLLYWMTGNVHDAEELTQETFLRALRRFESFQPGTQLRSWLLRIATNVCQDLRRQQKRARRVPLPNDLPSTEAAPDSRLLTADQAGLLKTALEDLSDTTRAVFHLRVQEDLPFREIAQLVGTTEQAARWHMHQARCKLLKRMND